MDVRAILLVTAPPGNGVETLGEVPIALLPAVGKPVLHHVIERLRRYSVEHISVVSDAPASPFLRHAAPPAVKWHSAPTAEIWRLAESVFGEHAQNGAEVMLLLRLGAYAELDFEQLIQFHLDQRQRITAVHTAGGTLDLFAISASRRNDAAYLLRHQFAGFRIPPARLLFDGYVNRLQNARDLRQLTLDALTLRCAITPAGRQTKPGVWVAEGARVHRAARLLAPAFIGAATKVRAAVVITRGSAVEHHCEIDCGTVVENSSVLPYTYVGAGLDVTHAVVGFKRLVNLRRDVEVEFADPKLINNISVHAPLRTLAAAGSLAGFLPKQLFRGLSAPSQREQPTALPQAVTSPSPVLHLPAKVEPAAAPDEFPADLAVVRRYGNQ